MIGVSKLTVSLIMQDRELQGVLSFIIKDSHGFRVISEYDMIEGNQRGLWKEQPDIVVIDLESLTSFDQLSFFHEKNMKSQILLISDITNH